MSKNIFSEEANFIYTVFVNHYEQKKISDHSVMIELEEYEKTIDDTAIEQGLQELQENNLVSSYRSYIDGSFDIMLRLKCENMLKSGIKQLETTEDENKTILSTAVQDMIIPEYIKKLIDKGLVATNGKTVITNSLDSVAQAIEAQDIIVTNIMLEQFINGKTGKPYSDSSINKAIELVNSR